MDMDRPGFSKFCTKPQAHIKINMEYHMVNTKYPLLQTFQIQIILKPYQEI